MRDARGSGRRREGRSRSRGAMASGRREMRGKGGATAIRARASRVRASRGSGTRMS